LAPAVAAIREYQRLNLVERARQMGEHLGSRLKDLMSRHPSIGDVRGLGLFWAVELVKNRRTKQPFNTKRDKISGKPLLVDAIGAEMLRRGVAVQAWLSHFVIAPPLIISQEEIDEGICALDESLHLADREVED
jgi:taurine--2-oxoglutarate transaminase